MYKAVYKIYAILIVILLAIVFVFSDGTFEKNKITYSILFIFLLVGSISKLWIPKKGKR